MYYGQCCLNGKTREDCLDASAPRGDVSGVKRKVWGGQGDTAKAWATGLHSYGRSNDGRVFFEDNIIYSHGRHWPIARFVPERRAALFRIPQLYYRGRVCGVTKTTGNHTHCAWHAVTAARITIIHVVDPSVEPSDADLAAHDERVAFAAKLAWRKRSDGGGRYAQHVIKDAEKKRDALRMFLGLPGVEEKQTRMVGATKFERGKFTFRMGAPTMDDHCHSEGVQIMISSPNTALIDYFYNHDVLALVPDLDSKADPVALGKKLARAAIEARVVPKQ